MKEYLCYNCKTCYPFMATFNKKIYCHGCFRDMGFHGCYICKVIDNDWIPCNNCQEKFCIEHINTKLSEDVVIYMCDNCFKEK